MANGNFSKGLPSTLNAPAFVATWRSRAMIVGLVCAAIAVIVAFLGQAQDHLGWEHLLRAWLTDL